MLSRWVSYLNPLRPTADIHNRFYHVFSYLYSLYFLQGLFAAIIMHLSVVVFKLLGMENQYAALFSSLLIIPWLCKILIAPYIERYWHLKKWLIIIQLGAAGMLLFIMWGLYAEHLQMIVIGFFILGFFATAYDVTSDGIYLHTLTHAQQNAYVGWRNFAFQSAMLFVQSVGLWLIALFMYQLAFGVFLGIILIFTYWHYRILPDVVIPKHQMSIHLISEIKNLPAIILLFALLFEAVQYQYYKIIPLFMLDPISAGGLGITSEQFALLYGIIGTTAFIVGAMITGVFLIKKNITQLLLPLAILGCGMSLVYVLLSHWQVQNIIAIGFALGVVQFIAGCKNSVYMVVLIRYATHMRASISGFAVLTTLMLTSMLGFGALSGYLQEWLGYPLFFSWNIILSLFIIFIVIQVKKQCRNLLLK